MRFFSAGLQVLLCFLQCRGVFLELIGRKESPHVELHSGARDLGYNKFLFPSWSFLFSLFLPLVLFILIKKKSNRRLPPGPTKLPIIGNLHNLFLAGDHHVPRVFRDLAKKHGPLMHLKVGQISNIVVSSSDVAKEFLRTHDINFATRPDNFAIKILMYNRSDVAFAPYGEYWRQMRKVCIQSLLGGKRVKSFDILRRDEVCNMVNILTKAATTGTPVNLSKLFLTLNNNITARSVFGDKCRHQGTFLDALREANEVSSGFKFCDFFPVLEDFTAWVTGLKYRTEKVHKILDNILDAIIDEHLEKSKKNKVVADGDGDLLDIILRIQKQNDFGFEFTMNNLKSVILDMFIAGTETSSTTLEWAMSELVKNPKTMKKAISEVRKVFSTDGYNNSFCNEMSYLQNVIKETFRLHPPAPLLIPRECRERCQINGYDIEEKTRLIVNAWAIGRDPNKWEDPEIFKPERFIGNPIDFKGSHFDLIPFGSGRRSCPGIEFGVANVELSLAMILYRFDWKMPNDVLGKELDMTVYFRGIMGRKHPLILVPIFPTIDSTITF